MIEKALHLWHFGALGHGKFLELFEEISGMCEWTTERRGPGIHHRKTQTGGRLVGRSNYEGQ